MEKLRRATQAKLETNQVAHGEEPSDEDSNSRGEEGLDGEDEEEDDDNEVDAEEETSITNI